MKIKNSPHSLVIDLDNSLLNIDLFKETLGKSLLKQPWIFFKTVALSLSNKAKAKTFISKECETEWSTLPYNKKIFDLIAKYREDGYQILTSLY